MCLLTVISGNLAHHRRVPVWRIPTQRKALSSSYSRTRGTEAHVRARHRRALELGADTCGDAHAQRREKCRAQGQGEGRKGRHVETTARRAVVRDVELGREELQGAAPSWSATAYGQCAAAGPNWERQAGTQRKPFVAMLVLMGRSLPGVVRSGIIYCFDDCLPRRCRGMYVCTMNYLARGNRDDSDCLSVVSAADC